MSVHRVLLGGFVRVCSFFYLHVVGCLAFVVAAVAVQFDVATRARVALLGVMLLVRGGLCLSIVFFQFRVFSFQIPNWKRRRCQLLILIVET